jgi:DNA-binding NtrC family response regulator
MKACVLVVDDNRSAADALARVLSREGYASDVAYDGHAAIARLDQGGVDVVLTDLKMEPVDGLAVLEHARSLAQPPEVWVMTGYGSVDAAVRAMQLGARDFLTKPVTARTILEQLGSLSRAGVDPVLGPSLAGTTLRDQAQAVQALDSNVLLSGEPGSGQAEVARLIAGTERVQVISHPGRADPQALADAPVLYAPNVDLLGEPDQVRLLQLLEGWDDGPRLIASAGPDWQEHALTSPSSRALYFRLAVLVLRVPPLRERRDDVEPLLSAMLAAAASRLGKPAPVPTATQLSALRRHRWPGNLRELSALAERAVVFGPSALDMDVPASEPSTGLPQPAEGFVLSAYLEDVERALLTQASQQADGDRATMSRLLGVERNTLRYKLNKYGLLNRS